MNIAESNIAAFGFNISLPSSIYMSTIPSPLGQEVLDSLINRLELLRVTGVTRRASGNTEGHQSTALDSQSMTLRCCCS